MSNFYGKDAFLHVVPQVAGNAGFSFNCTSGPTETYHHDDQSMSFRVPDNPLKIYACLQQAKEAGWQMDGKSWNQAMDSHLPGDMLTAITKKAILLNRSATKLVEPFWPGTQNPSDLTVDVKQAHDFPSPPTADFFSQGIVEEKDYSKRECGVREYEDEWLSSSSIEQLYNDPFDYFPDMNNSDLAAVRGFSDNSRNSQCLKGQTLRKAVLDTHTSDLPSTELLGCQSVESDYFAAFRSEEDLFSVALPSLKCEPKSYFGQVEHLNFAEETLKKSLSRKKCTSKRRLPQNVCERKKIQRCKEEAARKKKNECGRKLLRVIEGAVTVEGYQDSLGGKLTNPSATMSNAIASLLFSFAEAFLTDDQIRARFVLRQLSQSVTSKGDPIQRMAVYFMEGFKSRFSGFESLFGQKEDVFKPFTEKEVQLAKEEVQTHVPYWKYMLEVTCAQMLQAMEGAKRVHVLDLSLWGCNFWPQLINELLLRQGGPPVLRVTKVPAPGEIKSKQVINTVSGYESGSPILQAGRLSGFSIQFNILDEKLENLSPQNLQLREDETLIIYASNRFYTLASDTVLRCSPRDSALRALRSLKPHVLIFNELYANQNGPFFLSRLKDAFQLYSCQFESLNEALPSTKVKTRELFERIAGQNIINVVAHEGLERIVRPELPERWKLRLEDAGFSLRPCQEAVREELDKYVKQFTDSHSVTLEDGMLVINWKNRGMTTSSMWRVAC